MPCISPGLPCLPRGAETERREMLAPPPVALEPELPHTWSRVHPSVSAAEAVRGPQGPPRARTTAGRRLGSRTVCNFCLMRHARLPRALPDSHMLSLHDPFSFHCSFSVGLTTKPHDEHHLRRDFMITEEIQEVGKRENVHRSAKQYKYL